MYNKLVLNMCQQQHNLIHELVAQCPPKINLMYHTWSKLTPITFPVRWTQYIPPKCLLHLTHFMASLHRSHCYKNIKLYYTLSYCIQTFILITDNQSFVLQAHTDSISPVPCVADKWYKHLRWNHEMHHTGTCDPSQKSLY